jgi:hypothetical protein
VEDLDGVVLSGDGLAALIPGQRESGAMALEFGGVELQRGEAGVLSEMVSQKVLPQWASLLNWLEQPCTTVMSDW